MSTRANLVEATGLATAQNELIRPEGSQEEALNVNIDQKGLITPRRGFNDYLNPTNNVPSAGNIIKQIFDYKNRLFRHYSDKLEVEIASGSFAPISGSYNETVTNLRIKYKESNSNMYFTTDEGIKKISVAKATDLDGTFNIVDAGAIKATYLEGKTLSRLGGFLPAQSKVAYRFLFGYKDASSNLILGVPSYRNVVTNTAEDASTPEVSRVRIIATPNEGDYFILPANGIKYAVYFKKVTDTPPRKADTIGAKLIQVDIGAVVVAADIAAILANVLANNIPEFTYSIVVSATDTVEITAVDTGNLADIALGTVAGIGARLGVTIQNQGTTSTGSSAEVSVTMTIPPEATTDYFVQVYRTNFITAVEGLTIFDIDPGDEMNLVYEYGVQQADITAGEYTFVDNTPESFRASSTPLYTNEITGEGILQANERPPIAQDIELFRNSMFYANTKTKHFQAFDLISIDDFESSVTKIVISNDEVSRYYTFVGVKQVQTITTTAFASITNGSYFLISSANNERLYAVYFDKGGATAPVVNGAILIKVDITGTTTAAQVATALSNVFIDSLDFTFVPVSNVVTVTYQNTGYTDGILVGTSGFTIGTPLPLGMGELAGTDEGGDVLLSGLSSVGQAIDETARSLVKIINQDPDSPVIAEYLSISDDLPGKIRLENRSQKDQPFHVSIIDPRNNPTDPLYQPTLPIIAEEFNPALNYGKVIEAVTGEGLTTKITLEEHGFINGQEVYVSYTKDVAETEDLDSFTGFYTITYIDDDNFRISVPNTNLETTIMTEISIVVAPTTLSDNQEIPNRIYFSKFNEPEAVPSLNFINVGAKDEPIQRILALRDNLFVFKNDGIFIVSGTSAPNFSVRRLDNARIIAPDSAVVLNNQIYCLSEQGIVVVTDSGAGIISRNIENLVDDVVNLGNEALMRSFGIAYEQDRAYLLFTPKTADDTNCTQAFRYNIFERNWTRWEYNTTCGKVLSRDNTLYLSNGDRNYLAKERKNKDRTDHADRDFLLSIVSNGVDGKVLTISATNEIKVNDAITQTQVVTLTYFNRLLLKMDTFDTGLTPPTGSTFLDSFGVVAGDRIDLNIQTLNDYLRTLDSTNITVKSINPTNKREQMELLIDELNDEDTITQVKNYKKPETIVYETYVTAVDRLNNEITVNDERPFLQDDFTAYKNIEKIVRWNVQHYGDPSAFKQVSYVTIMFDQNNFNDAKAKFGSDVAQDLTEVNFKGKGIGYWGDLPWGTANNYWGGEGNDIPFRTLVPRGKQKCRYLTLQFEHFNAREYFRIVGISSVVRPISSKAYR